MRQVIVPLDPDSRRGREVASRLTTVLTELEQAIAERERRAASRPPSKPATGSPPTKPPQPRPQTSKPKVDAGAAA